MSTLKSIKDELDELLEIEKAKAKHHKEITKDTKSEYFYRGRVALMRHILATIDSDNKGKSANISMEEIRERAEL